MIPLSITFFKKIKKFDIIVMGGDYMSDLIYLKGVGPKTLSLLNKLEINDIDDLVTHYPYKYEVLKRSDV